MSAYKQQNLKPGILKISGLALGELREHEEAVSAPEETAQQSFLIDTAQK